MKLYVFLVNTGTTLTFDTELAVQTVLDLKHAIHAKYKIAPQHQVLVVNGGECMSLERRVCSYSAGTDTNPIFLFNKEMILCDRPPTIPKTTFSAENEMELKVEESLMMPAVFHTVASRTQLAVEMFEVAKKLCSFCERLVHDEHLQHQGWAAIMANLDDCTHSSQKLLCKFENAYSNYLQSVEDIKQKLTSLGTAVSVMAKIPLLECLTRHSYKENLERTCSPVGNGGTEEETEYDKSTESVLSSSDHKVTRRPLKSLSADFVDQGDACLDCGKEEHKECSQNSTRLENKDQRNLADSPSFNVSLLDWINVQDRPNDVESLVRKCFDSMSRLDPRIIQPFLSDCHETVAKLDNQNMKAIKGLEDRLYALDQMIASCNRLVNEQKDLAQGFLANQKRAENLKDPSVLPDLCLSHANQLMIMLTNHRKLLDIKQKCTTAKQELANNLQVRLKWCCYVMLHADQDGEKLQALLRLLTELLQRVRVVEALSTVPQMYCLAVVEVVRRKMFIKHYRKWANALVTDGKQLYEAEKSKRESFGRVFVRKSFLRNRLFRGLDSWPSSSFCTRKPRRFDYELPDISLKDLQFLQSCCPPEVQSFLKIPLLCDFEPLHQHVQVLHNLVKAAQSLDEMSQTITDLLNEQKASNGHTTSQPTATPRSESTAGTMTTTSSKTLPPLSLQDPLCPSVILPAALEDLSPDSIDAHTFDFETIAHPNVDQVLKQGSLDVDSLAESPESDFMSAVNEFVIEDNPTSPNLISDPQSPEMMVESLYSSVINAIDSRRMQDTSCSKDSTIEVASLKACIEKYKTAVQEYHSNLRIIKEDIYHFRALVQKEQCSYSKSVKFVSEEIKNIIETIKQSLTADFETLHQKEMAAMKTEHNIKYKILEEAATESQAKTDMLQKDILERNAVLQSKNNELAQVRNEMKVIVSLHNEKDQKLQELEKALLDHEHEMQEQQHLKQGLVADIKKLHQENEDRVVQLRTELQSLEESHLKTLEECLQAKHKTELENMSVLHVNQLEQLKKENHLRVEQLIDSHAHTLQEKEQIIQELLLKVSELSELRYKLEVELSLKEAETDDLRHVLEESKAHQEEAVKCSVDKETEKLKKEILELKHQIQANNDENEVNLAELRSLMGIEKDRCISELVDRYEEEIALLKSELNKLTNLYQQTLNAEVDLQEHIKEQQHRYEEELKFLKEQKEDWVRGFQQHEENYEKQIHALQKEKEELVTYQEKERALLLQTFSEEKAAAVQNAVKALEREKETSEKELLEKIQLLESQRRERESLVRGATPPQSSEQPSSEYTTLHEEKTRLLEQLEQLEKRKNEELQALKTSLIAEQQTNFNTVLTREKLKKEILINDLKDKLEMVTQQQEKDKGLIETLSADRAHLLLEKKKLEEEVNKLRSNTLLSSAYLPPGSTPSTDASGMCSTDQPSESERLASVASISEENRVDSAMEASMMALRENMQSLSEEKQRIMLLERTLQMKEEENKRLNQRLMSQSMSSVSSRHSEKIAIRDFQVGDLVLIILDERHDNYVLFTVGPTLYFLHSESLGSLDLKPASGSPKKPWVLGKVMEKEYCQAKKAQNRFKVPLGTKFYRVKAVPWNKKV
ncbi:RB1-inducible coiled-coil protein 1 [Protopterus annectens]|uniref:RB1-inducible coiled-coil protein 1 n=1 Tax=Protopterus annectens TaxID=7888 RepID=UPI001CFC1D3C|nr:RB1-inducible coiled-coil protein 1 [Protopterus annectens]